MRFKKKPIGLHGETRFESYLGLLLAIEPSTTPNTFLVSEEKSLHCMMSNASSCSKSGGNKTLKGVRDEPELFPGILCLCHDGTFFLSNFLIPEKPKK